jgi:hypothetical protein
MFFSDFKQLSTVLKQFQLTYREESIGSWEKISVPISLKTDINFNLLELAYDGSEAIICETLIFPILKEAWKPFTKDIMLWSHQAMEFDTILSGTPDYLFTKKSVLGKIVMDKPLVAIVEAKKDDFTGGWGQCAAEMYTAQQINKNDDLKIFGIVSNGRFWEFATLQQRTFTKFREISEINDLDELFSVLTHILKICQMQIRAFETKVN